MKRKAPVKCVGNVSCARTLYVESRVRFRVSVQAIQPCKSVMSSNTKNKSKTFCPQTCVLICFVLNIANGKQPC